jgi:8-oxo-dGTP diphosphatase
VGIIQRDDKVLIAKRPPDKPYSGYWEFPGGKVENNESSVYALHRELNEELGISVTSAQIWFQHQYTYPDRVVFLDIYRVTSFLSEPKAKENQVLRWATLEEMATLLWLEGNYFIIEQMQLHL